ncbi:Methyladenine glycosylase [Corchorus olitorius]|uniref:Methyladenine glycosylase n=1 Tax=Corchorus olitorius TaxID=93759 RepID=A0A1R3I593_9ROSI|nr:Methyladenine glycosylase [Corchorus olitorius]
MCSSKAKVTTGVEMTPAVARINGRPVLQPTCNRVPSLDRRNSLKKNIPPLSPPPPSLASTPPSPTTTSRSKALSTPPLSPKSKSPRPVAIKRGSDPNASLNSSSEKVAIPPIAPASQRNTASRSLERKKSKSFKEGMTMGNNVIEVQAASLSYSSASIIEAPGSIAAVRREQVALQQAQRKMRIAHYGRSKSAKFESQVVPLDASITKSTEEEKRCSFITANSDPIYVAYHDEEWGVPLHDDSILFELLVLSGAQVGSDWTSILKKRHDFREAFSNFNAETVAKFTDKEMTTISSQYAIDISRVRVFGKQNCKAMLKPMTPQFDDNHHGKWEPITNVKNILCQIKVKAEFGSFDKYIWGFVNHKAISTQYKFGHKIPVKTSKSESISKDMVRRGFRFVGPTVVHSFMQAAGLTNDHLITCHRHLPCTLLAARPRPAESPAPQGPAPANDL